MISFVHLLEVKEYFAEEGEEVSHDHGVRHATESRDEDFIQLGRSSSQLKPVILILTDGFSQENIDLLDMVD